MDQLVGGSSHPYDIYASTQPMEGGRLSGILHSPVTVGAWLATDLVAIPWLTSTKGLQRSMLPGQWDMFKNQARLHYGGDVRNLVLRGGHRQLFGGVTAGNLTAPSGGIMSRDRIFYKNLRSTYGRSAAGRIGASRMLSGLSRGLFAYSMLQLGIGLINGINELIESYEPPAPKIPWHRDLETGGNFVDTRSAQTQRARAIQAIHNTQLSTRAALGNEASFLHMNR